MKRLAVTGHRPQKLPASVPGRMAIRSEIEKTILEFNPDQMFAGGAMGIDTDFALLAIELQIPLVIAIPCEGQERGWPKDAQQLYHKILQAPNVRAVLVSTGPYHPSKMHIRNRWIVDQLVGSDDALLSVWDGSPGGTKACRDYAIRKGKKVINIDPKVLVSLKVKKPVGKFRYSLK